MSILLGLDLGTTNCKALAIERNGKLVARASAPTPTLDAGSKAEAPMYDAEALWHISARLIREIEDQLGPEQLIDALSVASMGEAGVLVDASGKALAPVLTWHDRRTVPWIEWWRQRLRESQIYAITGLPLDYIYSANKLLWHQAKDPQTFARAHTWLSLSDWISYRLTGVRSTSYSMASRTMLFDLSTRQWSDEMLRLAGLPEYLMPPALPSGQILGQVTAEAARETGLLAGTPVVAGGHDHICAALATGVTSPGHALNSSGTAETILSALDAPLLDGNVSSSGLCCGCHTARDRYYLVGGFMGGATVAWLGQILGAESLTDLMDEAAEAPVLANDIWFLPYVGGSGPPHRDPHAWGAWLGLRLHHTRSDLARAAMEGLGFALRYLLSGHQQLTGDTIQELRSVGGGSRNGWRQQLKADILGVPVEVPEMGEYTAHGAGLLAGIGVGVFADEAQAEALAYRPNKRFEPDPILSKTYDDAYRNVFLNLYPTLRPLPLTSH
ncbi:MAG: carbohydrate kinase [Chloroflexi bacterium]|nr:carbohydrate kinase [Chloroflexota bacterium]